MTWRSKSEAGKKIIADTQNGDTDYTSPPKVVHDSYELHLDCPTPNFLVALTRERAKAGYFLSNHK